MIRWRLGLAFGLAVALVVGGCGSGAPGPGSVSVSLSSVAASTGDAGPYEVATDGDGVTLTGVVDPADHRIDQTITVAPGPTVVRSITDPTGTYSMATDLPAGKRWVLLSPTATPCTTSAPTAIRRAILGLYAGQVVSFLSALGSSGVTLTRAGHATVRGVRVTHYVVSIPLRVVLGDTAPERSLSADVYVDAAGRLRRFNIDITRADVDPSLGEVPGQMVLDLYGFGTTPPVTLPPPSQVVSQADMHLPATACPTG